MKRLLPQRWWGVLKREWLLYHLGDPSYRFMFDAPPENDGLAEIQPMTCPRDDNLLIRGSCH